MSLEQIVVAVLITIGVGAACGIIGHHLRFNNPMTVLLSAIAAPVAVALYLGLL